MALRSGAGRRSVVRVSKSGGQFHVWFCPDGKRQTLAGAIGVGVAADAHRYGQDLVGELVDRALLMADRHAARAESS